MVKLSDALLKLDESSLSRLWQKHKNSDAGTITAYRGERTKSENQSLNRVLSSALIGKGYSVTSIQVVFIENKGTSDEKRVKEQSFIVFDRNNSGNLKKDLIQLGEKFQQESITYWNVKEGKYYLIGTSKEGNNPGYKQEILLGKPMFSKDGECYSSINGRPFTIKESLTESDYDHTILDHTNHGKMWYLKLKEYVFEKDKSLDELIRLTNEE